MTEVPPLHDRPGQPPELADRRENFERLARARACGDMVVLPRMLTGNDRRLHVRQTLREDHQERIAHRAEAAEAKFAKLAGSRFSFFRGTALLFYRDMAGEDAWLPTVLAAGDVHPENFGVMPNADNVPMFSINDFDEAYYAPFTWDLKRGATGFLVAADEIGGHGRGDCRTVARRFVQGYVTEMRVSATDEQTERTELRQDNAPPLVAALIARATKRSRADWLARSYLDEQRRGFRADDRLVPVSSRRGEFQQTVDRYLGENDIAVPMRGDTMRVKDVAERKGQGTASLGLTRYYLLVEGPAGDGTDDIVLEMKQARRSALADLVPPSGYAEDGAADRVANAQHVHLAHGDAFYGSVEHDGVSFLVRERAPYRKKIKLHKLSLGEWGDYAETCGGVLARAHARSDGAGAVDHDVEPAVAAAIGIEELFVDDVVRFADEAFDRLRRDHEMFVADHAMGAFGEVDVVYR